MTRLTTAEVIVYFLFLAAKFMSTFNATSLPPESLDFFLLCSSSKRACSNTKVRQEPQKIRQDSTEIKAHWLYYNIYQLQSSGWRKALVLRSSWCCLQWKRFGKSTDSNELELENLKETVAEVLIESEKRRKWWRNGRATRAAKTLSKSKQTTSSLQVLMNYFTNTANVTSHIVYQAIKIVEPNTINDAFNSDHSQGWKKQLILSTTLWWKINLEFS